ncbi:hypothetical protein [Streptomyces indicus]|uniref:4-amino-4-deoxy-L-arabinose transferase n=1 Tax=Streptomyces indicus TaxID=417292 RepID=A0A1G9CFU6_9ACTN|nr:hypothetical protein [Streptomyces indicus]SDK50466.1 hypothetical protein SAMN05421806_108105 [Streptomyces indicus]
MLTRRPHLALAAVAGAGVLLSVLVLPWAMPLGWDELVYATRFSPYAGGVDVEFSAPRTRGVPLLIAPVALWSDSVVLLRVWLLLLWAAALYLGFLPWLRVLRPRSAGPVVVLGAAVYASVWSVLFYAGHAMPNHYTAMGALAAVGCLLHVPRGPASYAGIVAGLATATLMRPNDGVWMALPLLVWALLTRAPAAAGAVTGGVAAGLLPWIVEAELRFGGVRERLHEASGVQGGVRPVLSVRDHLAALDGRLLCRPCDADQPSPPGVMIWVLLAVLVVLGVRAAPRPRRAVWLLLATAACAAGPYFFLVPYAAPRFLFPAYALLALPAAFGLLAVRDAVRGSRARTALVIGVLAVHLAGQLLLLYRHGGIQDGARSDWERVARVLREQGVRTPCVIGGNAQLQPVAHAAGCRADKAAARPHALVLLNGTPPPWARTWERHPVPDTYNKGWSVLVNPDRAIPASGP